MFVILSEVFASRSAKQNHSRRIPTGISDLVRKASQSEITKSNSQRSPATVIACMLDAESAMPVAASR
jgi:hypothetical protein